MKRLSCKGARSFQMSSSYQMWSASTSELSVGLLKSTDINLGFYIFPLQDTQ
jgi:hypothetical protein